MTEGERTVKVLNKNGWTLDPKLCSWKKPGHPSVPALTMLCDPPAELRRVGDSTCAREVEKMYAEGA